MVLYCGIDLHSTNNYVAILDETFGVVKGRRLGNDFEEVLKLLAPYREDLVGRWVDGSGLSRVFGQHEQGEVV